MDKKFNPRAVEAGKYDFWRDHRLFEPSGNGKPFSILLPPPNVTGHLHLGHAWDVSLQDTIIRYKKLRGYRTLWVPGMDHAGIATQTKFEKIRSEQGLPNRLAMGRTNFLNALNEWKDDQANFIRKQWAKMGLALSYEHEIFTMDQHVNKAVNEVFQTLFREGLIYRAKTLVNWDPLLKTAISNIEVIHREVVSKMYYFKYQSTDGKTSVLVATTRPETMFGDTALFANPNDPRFMEKNMVFTNPVNGRELPLLFDDYVDMEFGTGIMKCTPAHDFNDYALGKKYKLDVINVMNPDATMNEECGTYAGMDHLACRQKLVEDLERNGVLDHIEEIKNSVGFSERTDAIVQPYMSDQWFVKMKPLASAVLDVQKSGSGAAFFPPRFNDVLTQWLTNIEDWCISRQLWWGHQIPVWYGGNSEVYCGDNPPDGYIQDPDVLDTWFSSALWPMICFNWPDRGALWTEFFPSNVLVTGYDIIFFWVSRMMMQTRHFCHENAFHDVLIHGLIRDAQGRKMSKSLGNGVDPMDVIDAYGCDSLRLFLTATVSHGEDLLFSDEKLRANWNFLNKLWNGSRFIFEQDGDDLEPDWTKIDAVDQWILFEFDRTHTTVTDAFNNYQFVVATKTLVNFTWNLLNNQYLEFVKFYQKRHDAKNKIRILRSIIKKVLIMLHPQCPFITEEIYQMFQDKKLSIMMESWPEPFHVLPSPTGEALCELWEIIRQVRAEKKIVNGKTLGVQITPLKDIDTEAMDVYFPLLNIIQKKDVQGTTKLTASFSLIIEDDIKAEQESLRKQITFLEQEVARSKGILSNANFVAKAPAAKVQMERDKLHDYEEQLRVAREKLHD